MRPLSKRDSTPALVARLGSNRFAVTGHPSLRYTPDGARIVSMGAGIGLWDASSGERLAWAPRPPSASVSAFTPDGSKLIVPCVREVLVLDARTLATLHSWPAPNDAPAAVDAVVAWGESALVASALHGRAILWEAASGRVVLRLQGVTRALALTPDGARVATVPIAEDGPCAVHEIATGKLLATSEGHGTGAAVFSADGERLVVGSRSGHLRVYDARDGRLLHEALAHPGSWLRGARLVGEILFTWGTDDHVRRWELRAEAPLLRSLGAIAVPYGGLHGALSDDGRSFANAHSGVIEVRRIDGDAQPVSSAARLRGVAGVDLSADHTHVVTRLSGGGSRVWRVANAEVVFEHASLAIHEAAECFALASGPVRVLRFARRDAARATSGAAAPIGANTSVAPDGSFWIDALNGRLRCFDAAGHLRWECHQAPGAAPLIALDARSLVYCVCDAQGFPLRANVLRADTGDVVAQTRLRRGIEWVAASSHDGTQLALRVENGLRIVSPGSAAKASRVSPKVAVSVAAFAPDGATVALGTHSGEVCLASSVTGRIRTRWTAHYARVSALSFSRDGARLISGSDDGSTAVWLLAEVVRG